MNLTAETASLELRAAAFKEHGAVPITDLVPEDVCQLIKLINLHPSDWEVEAGVLKQLHPDAPTVAPPSLCTRTFEQITALGGRPCSSCKQLAVLHRSERDEQPPARSIPRPQTHGR